MRNFTKKLYSTISLYACVCATNVFLGFAGGGVTSALAACVTGAQCSVTDGTVQNIVGGNYQAADYDPSIDPLNPADAALYVKGAGSALHGVDITITDPVSYTYWFNVLNNGNEWKKTYGIYAEDGGVISLKDSFITTNEEAYSELITVKGAGSQILLDNVTIEPGMAGFMMQSVAMVEGGGYLKMVNSKVVGYSGIHVKTGSVDLVNSHITGVLGFGRGWNGVKDTSVNVVNMQGGFLGGLFTLSGENIFNVTGGTVGYNNGTFNRLVFVGSNQEMNRSGGGSTLLDNGNLTINAHASQLYGATEMGTGAYLGMNLTDGSTWTTASIHDRKKGVVNHSDVSVLNVDNSTVKFDSPLVDPTTGDFVYGTINVGGDNTKGATDVYTSNNGLVIFNSFVNDGGLPSNQFTDKLVITGDVLGKTQVKVNEMAGSTGDVDWTSQNGTNLAHEGISLIQITGKAKIDSFDFEGGYTTFHRQPYVYKLYGFEDSATGTWDFRLQNEWLWDGDDWRRQVVPQVSTYLTAPNALFQARGMDFSNLRNRLDDMRYDRMQESEAQADNAGADGDDEKAKQRNLFLFAYGGNKEYQTDLAILEYGYNADIDYKALQFGGNLFNFEREKEKDREHAEDEKSNSSEWLFGLSGSFGSLAIQTDRKDSRKSKLDIYAITPYLTWLKDSGFYADFVVSYGQFDGKVSTRRYAETARLKGSTLAASLDIGMPFALGSNGWSIEPQAGFAYQKLSFKNQEDADNFPIELGAPTQMIGRIGGKLMKDKISDDIRKYMIYGKLNYLHDFTGSNYEVWLGDPFQVGQYGNHIEAGLGLNWALMPKFKIFGDFTWTQRIGGAGSNGLAFNAGGNLKW